MFIYLLRCKCFYDTWMHAIEISKQETGKPKLISILI